MVDVGAKDDHDQLVIFPFSFFGSSEVLDKKKRMYTFWGVFCFC